MSYISRSIERMEAAEAAIERDTRAVASDGDRDRIYEPVGGSGTCRNCGTCRSTHLRPKYGLERLVCAESVIRAAYGDR